MQNILDKLLILLGENMKNVDSSLFLTLVNPFHSGKVMDVVNINDNLIFRCSS